MILMSNALKHRQEIVARAALIKALGWNAEPPIAAERYCATTGEIWQIVAEKQGVETANKIERDAKAAAR